MGAFADITSVTQSNEMIANVEDKYVVVSMKRYEKPHRDLVVTTNVAEPYQFELDTLVGKNGSNIPPDLESLLSQSEKPTSLIASRDNSETWKTIDVCSHSGLLDGTIENHECDPLEDCPECRGDGRCTKCHGSGDVDCHVCHGNGQCRDCHGHGRTRCTECGGDGRCRKCGGSGEIVCKHCHGTGEVRNPDYNRPGYSNSPEYFKCQFCHGAGRLPCEHCSASGIQKTARFLFGANSHNSGSGRCPKCDGTGELTCKTCKGTGNCTSCQGSGKETCSHCHGEGNCPNCNGSGKVTCRRCEGSGWYQTFSIYDTKCYVKKWEYVSLEELKEGLILATKRPVYKNLYRKWKYKDVIEFDKTKDIKLKSKQDFGNDEAYQRFEKAYDQATRESGSKDTPYEKAMEMEKVPVTKVEFTLNDKEYSVYVMGDNGVVMCEELPVKVEMYKPSFFQKLKMTFTKKKRHLSYIKMAAYIFQCDGKDMSESHVLDVFIAALKLKPAKQEALKEQLKKYNSNMPYEVFRKEISSLFSSKKTLTFAWQCMAVDKKVSPQENQLFEKLLAEYKIEPSEVETMKRFATKYSLLKDEQLVSEYLRK